MSTEKRDRRLRLAGNTLVCVNGAMVGNFASQVTGSFWLGCLFAGTSCALGSAASLCFGVAGVIDFDAWRDDAKS